jgi:hypothetical protein
MSNKWEFWGSISLFLLAIGIWLLTYQDMPQFYPFACLLGGMVMFLVMLACYIGQDPENVENTPNVDVPDEELANCMIHLIFICRYLPSGQIQLRDLVSLLHRKGHRAVAAMAAIKVLLRINHLAARNGYLFYFENKDECIDFKLQTRLHGLKASMNKP